MNASDRTIGVILAGGLSRRLGGGDKGLALLGGRSLVERVAARVGPQVDRLVLNANGDPTRFASLRLTIVPDADEERPGPLAGILAGLDEAAASADPPGHVLSVPCDAPFLPADLVTRLHVARRAAGAAGAVAASGGRIHPTVGLWPVEAREAVRDALAEGSRRVISLVEALRLTEASWPAEPFDPFANVNDPEGLQSAADILARYPRA